MGFNERSVSKIAGEEGRENNSFTQLIRNDRLRDQYGDLRIKFQRGFLAMRQNLLCQNEVFFAGI